LNDSDVTPERALLVGILDRAFRDATDFGRGEERRDARIWFEDDDCDEWSFCWVCAHLNLDPLQVRKGLTRYAEDRKKQPKAIQMKPSHGTVVERYLNGSIGDEITLPVPTRELA
jgi:hypothetical protein